MRASTSTTLHGVFYCYSSILNFLSAVSRYYIVASRIKGIHNIAIDCESLCTQLCVESSSQICKFHARLIRGKCHPKYKLILETFCYISIKLQLKVTICWFFSSHDKCYQKRNLLFFFKMYDWRLTYCITFKIDSPFSPLTN